ncbi:hypothetical protein TNCT_733971 [Trichonephila clavata]|uniref:Uncharacterized protein n=1 Tax=Trichonephila clavata TaxID=2740835 RepID=A0A8X6FX22_TRICU|nr:hypothetical protein TNCT_733971 [Trichonephila clavata]
MPKKTKDNSQVLSRVAAPSVGSYGKRTVNVCPLEFARDLRLLRTSLPDFSSHNPGSLLPDSGNHYAPRFVAKRSVENK